MPSASGPLHAPLRHMSRRRYGPAGVTTSSSTCSTLAAPAAGRAARYLRAVKLVDAVSLRSRRRKLRLFLDELQPGPDTTVLDVGADEVGFGGAGGQSGCATHNFFEELYPWRGADHGARAARRRGLPAPLPRRLLRPGRRLRAALPGRVVRRRLLERGDRARRRPGAAAAVRRGGAAGRPACLPDDAEPLVPGRGAHAAAARALAARRPPRAGPTTSPARAGRATTTSSAAATSGASFPVPVRIVNLGLTLVAIT